MKAGLSLVELAKEIERQQNAKKDLIASTENMEMRVVPQGNALAPQLRLGDEYEFGINRIAHRQIGDHTGIPARYYDRMLEEAPELLATNVGEWFRRYPAPRMVRTLDGKARAFLSDRYRPLEHSELAEAVLPVLMELGVEIMSSQITETRLYIKAVDHRINRDIPTGKRLGDGSHTIFDTVSPAIVISNSEVGMGALSVEAGVFTKACTNLAIFGARSMKRYHIGGKHELGEQVYHLLSDETRRLTDKAIWHQVRDVVKGAFEEARFDAALDELKGMTEQKIEGDPVKVIELTSKKFGLNEGERSSILRHLIEGGDLTRYGLYAAFTRAAHDIEDYDRSTDFEKMGGRLIELPANDWKELATAA